MAIGPGREEVKTLSISVTAGAGVCGTGTLTPVWSVARWVRIIPTSESDTYGVKFLDGDGDMVIYRTSLTGTFSEQLEISLGTVRSVQILDSSSTGTYKVKFDMN